MEAEKIYEYGQQEDEKRRKAKTTWGAAREKKGKEPTSEAPVAYDQVFAKLQAATGIQHVEELVAAFVAAEDHNFSMFNYVNELNQDAERLEEQAAALQQEAERHTGAGASESGFRKRMLASLEEKVAAMRARAEAAGAKHAAASAELERLLSVVQAVFEDAGCAGDASAEQLGGTSATEANVLQCLALTEQRASELLLQCTQRLAATGALPVSVRPSCFHVGFFHPSHFPRAGGAIRGACRAIGLVAGTPAHVRVELHIQLTLRRSRFRRLLLSRPLPLRSMTSRPATAQKRTTSVRSHARSSLLALRVELQNLQPSMPADGNSSRDFVPRFQR